MWNVRLLLFAGPELSGSAFLHGLDHLETSLSREEVDALEGVDIKMLGRVKVEPIHAVATPR